MATIAIRQDKLVKQVRRQLKRAYLACGLLGTTPTKAYGQARFYSSNRNMISVRKTYFIPAFTALPSCSKLCKKTTAKPCFG